MPLRREALRVFLPLIIVYAVTLRWFWFPAAGGGMGRRGETLTPASEKGEWMSSFFEVAS